MRRWIPEVPRQTRLRRRIEAAFAAIPEVGRRVVLGLEASTADAIRANDIDALAPGLVAGIVRAFRITAGPGGKAGHTTRPQRMRGVGTRTSGACFIGTGGRHVHIVPRAHPVRLPALATLALPKR